jgi:NADH dehydrogenase
MTVMVTGAGGVVGRAVVKALLARDEVRATVRRPVAAEYLRQLGAKVAIREIDRPDALSEILPRCHTLVHLIGGPNQPDAEQLFAANHGSVLTALAAAREAGTERFVFLSVPGADPDATQPFLRAKGLAEEAIGSSGLEHAIVRSTHVYGLGGLWFTAAVEGALADPPFVCGIGDQAIAPVFAEDVGAVVAAIDDASSAPAGTWGLEGPDALTADGFARLLRDDDIPIAHRAGDWRDDRAGCGSTRHRSRPPSRPTPDAARVCGLTPLLDGLAHAEAAAGLDAG